MIPRKKKTCKGCGNERFIFSKGMCEFCASKSFKPVQTRTPIKRTYNKKDNSELNKFFDEHIAILSKIPYSYESGKKISEPSRLNIAHIFPKRNHKSVETNDFNVVYLTWQEHTTFDYLLDTHNFAEIEKRFPKTWKLLKNVLPLVQERTKLVLAIENYL